jgi:hypothetical protein
MTAEARIEEARREGYTSECSSSVPPLVINILY